MIESHVFCFLFACLIVHRFSNFYNTDHTSLIGYTNHIRPIVRWTETWQDRREVHVAGDWMGAMRIHGEVHALEIWLHGWSSLEGRRRSAGIREQRLTKGARDWRAVTSQRVGAGLEQLLPKRTAEARRIWPSTSCGCENNLCAMLEK
jgi:hypothetical protein